MISQKNIVIHSKEAAEILGCSAQAAARRIRKCKRALGKLPHQLLTFGEFCEYYGIKLL